MQFNILGPLEVVDDQGTLIPLGGPQRRRLLAALLVEPGQPVPVSTLADVVWSGTPPPDASALLQGLVTRLRRVVEPGRPPRAVSELLPLTPAGYLLRVTDDGVDARRFDWAVEAATMAVASHLTRRALDLAESVMMLWRGPALVDIIDSPFAVAEAQRLEERHLQAQEIRLEALLALGNFQQTVAELEALVAAHPYRERLCMLRMAALYRAGRQAEALRAYSSLRIRLLDELGIDPSRAISELENRILRHDPSLDAAYPLRTLPQLRDVAAVPAPGPPDLPRPRPTGEADVHPFVGRTAELDALRRVVASTAAGRGIALVSGEPGVGKTRLISELAREAVNEGMLVLAGRCDEELQVAFQPWVQALQLYLSSAGADLDIEGLGRLPAELTRLVPEIADLIGDVSPPAAPDRETERYRLFDAVTSWLSHASQRRPIVLLIDDLHAGVLPTLLLMRHLVKSDEPMRLALIATYRSAAMDHSPEFDKALADLHRIPTTTWLDLEGFDLATVTELVQAVVGVEPDPSALEVIRQIHFETEGNPFFVGELVRHLGETGAAKVHDGRWTVDRSLSRLGLPEGVRSIINSRLARLGDTTRMVLRAAAVAGREFSYDLVADALEGSRESVLHALEVAAAADLVREVANRPGTFRFSHALVREALYRELPATRRVLLHGAVGRAIAARPPSSSANQVEELAYHFGQAAEIGDPALAVDYATRAGDQAMQLLAFEVAASHYARALDHLPTAGPEAERGRANLLIRRADALAKAGATFDAKGAYTLAAALAERLGDAEMLAQAALGHGTAGMMATEADAGLIELLEHALSALPQVDSTTRAKVLARLAAELSFTNRATERRTLSHDAVAMARRLGDAATLGAALSSHHYALVGRDPASLGQRLTVADELLAVARQTGDRDLLFHAHRWLIIDNMERGEIAIADQHIEAHQELARTARQPLYAWWSMVFGAMRALHEGQYAEAERQATAAWQLGRATSEAAFAFYAVQMGAVVRARGELANAGPTLRALVDQYHDAPAWRVALASFEVELGHPDVAAAELERFAADDYAALPDDLGWLPAIHGLGDICAEVGAIDRAERLVELLAPFADRTVVVGSGIATNGCVARVLARLCALLGHRSEATHYFERAMRLTERTHAWPELARTAVHYASAVATGAADGPPPAELLDRARELAGTYGLLRSLRLDDAGATTSRPRRPAPR